MPNIRSHKRIIRHRRVRSKLQGTAARPRLVVSRSLKHISAQVIDDLSNKTLCAAFDYEITTKKGVKPVDISHLVGQSIANKAIAKGINTVVFDRAGYAYHGRVRALAEGAREGGLQF